VKSTGYVHFVFVSDSAMRGVIRCKIYLNLNGKLVGSISVYPIYNASKVPSSQAGMCRNGF
jgi:hypothetical protein